MTTRDDEVRAGRDAQYLLDHPIFQEAFSSVRSGIRTEWERSPARDAEGREKLWLMLKLVDRIEAHVRSVAETGELAGRMLEEERRRTFFGGYE